MVRIPWMRPMKKAANSGSFIAHPVDINLPMTLGFAFGLDWRHEESLIKKLANRSTRLEPC